MLVRDEFRGKSVVNAVIDLPFALPTIVAGLVLLAFYGPHSPVGIHLAFTRGAVYLALLFVTLPFVVRTVQPVLGELDLEMEEAARSLGAGRFTIFRRSCCRTSSPGSSRADDGLRPRGRRDRRDRDHLREPPLPHRGRLGFIFNQIGAETRAAPRRSRSCCSRSPSPSCSSSAASGATPRGTSVSRLGLRAFAIGYLALILIAPLALVTYRTFGEGASGAWQALRDPEHVHAFQVTLTARRDRGPAEHDLRRDLRARDRAAALPGKGLVNAFVDLPLALSPVVVGVALFALYGRSGWFGVTLSAHNIQVLFSLPSIVLATTFVSVPFVAREVIPTLREIGNDQEQAAHTLGASGWQTFWRITLPSIRWAVIYGVVLTAARCLGEYGAVAVVSGSIQGKTETATLRVQEEYQNLNFSGAYAISLVLAAIAVAILVLMSRAPPAERTA